MYEFEYHSPDSIADAVTLVREADEAKFLAGGQTLLPTMKHRLASPEQIVDLGSIDALTGISADEKTLTIGAMTTHADVAASQIVRDTLPALASLASEIGDPAVRNRGTLGGSIANNDPAADYPAALLALGATICTDRRELNASEFFVGMFETALEEDELIVRVVFPRPDRAAYCKFANPASRYAIVGVFVALFDGKAQVAVTGATSYAHRATGIEKVLADGLEVERIDGVTIPVERMNADLHASAEYRAHLVKVIAKRALSACLDE
jgi:carbon-monoxide dehydrogenase medium subunit